MSGSRSLRPEVRHNPAGHRYEAWVDGAPVGHVLYREGPEPGRVAFLHTEVTDRLEGRGIGRELVRNALDAARAQGQQVAPVCPFVAAYLRGHSDYWDLIPHEYDRAIGRTR